MKFYTKETIEIDKPYSIVCDMCKTEYTDEMELQEFHFINFTGGYGSVFGDGNKIEIDICQHCLKGLIDKLPLPKGRSLGKLKLG